MQLGRTYIYSNFLKAIMIFATMLLTVGVALILTPRTDMSEVAKYTVVGIVWLVALYVVVSRRFRTMAEGNAPRPWWRMTASRFLGWAFAIFFAAAGIWIAAGSNLLETLLEKSLQGVEGGLLSGLPRLVAVPLELSLG